MVRRIESEGAGQPNFIGSWLLEDDVVCDGVVDFFERNKGKQKPGSSGAGAGRVDRSVKNSTDIIIFPKDLENEGHEIISMYIKKLNDCYFDYLVQWDFLKSFLNKVHIGEFNIQKYDDSGHYGKLHSERMSLDSLHRILVWMTYLNDVPDGGETEFPFFDLKVKPQKGKTLIWPAEWTHAHRGGVVRKGPKYIITGWMHFSDLESDQEPV